MIQVTIKELNLCFIIKGIKNISDISTEHIKFVFNYAYAIEPSNSYNITFREHLICDDDLYKHYEFFINSLSIYELNMVLDNIVNNYNDRKLIINQKSNNVKININNINMKEFMLLEVSCRLVLK